MGSVWPQLLPSRAVQHYPSQKAKTSHLKTASAIAVTHTERRFCTTVTKEPPWQTYFLNSFPGGRHIEFHSTLQRHKSTTVLSLQHDTRDVLLLLTTAAVYIILCFRPRK